MKRKEQGAVTLRMALRLTALVCLLSFFGVGADAAWQDKVSDGKVTLWEWRTAACFDTMPEKLDRMLLVWRSGKADEDKPEDERRVQDNDGKYTYWTKNARYVDDDADNELDCKDPIHDICGEDYCCIRGETCDSRYFEKNTTFFYTDSDLGTLKITYQIDCDVSAYLFNAGGTDVRVCGWDDAFDYAGNEDTEHNSRGYQLSEFTLYPHTDKKDPVKTEDYSYLGTASKTKDGSSDGHVVYFFTNGASIAAYGQNKASDIKYFKQFRVYFGEPVEYSVTDSLYVAKDQVYNVMPKSILTGTVTVEPGGVLCFTNGVCLLDAAVNNYGTVILESGATVYPYEPGAGTDGTIHCYGSGTSFFSKNGVKSEAEGYAGEGTMVVMPDAKYSQSPSFGGLLLDKGAILENHGTMLITRSLIASHSQIHNYRKGRILCGYYTDTPSAGATGAEDFGKADSRACFYAPTGADSLFIDEGELDKSFTAGVAELAGESNGQKVGNREQYIKDRLNEWMAANPLPYAAFYSRYTEETLTESLSRTRLRRTFYEEVLNTLSDGSLGNGLATLSEVRAYLVRREVYLATQLESHQRGIGAARERFRQEAAAQYPFSEVTVNGMTVNVSQEEIRKAYDAYLEEKLIPFSEWKVRKILRDFLFRTKSDEEQQAEYSADMQKVRLTALKMYYPEQYMTMNAESTEGDCKAYLQGAFLTPTDFRRKDAAAYSKKKELYRQAPAAVTAAKAEQEKGVSKSEYFDLYHFLGCDLLGDELKKQWRDYDEFDPETGDVKIELCHGGESGWAALTWDSLNGFFEKRLLTLDADIAANIKTYSTEAELLRDYNAYCAQLIAGTKELYPALAEQVDTVFGAVCRPGTTQKVTFVNRLRYVNDRRGAEENAQELLDAKKTEIAERIRSLKGGNDRLWKKFRNKGYGEYIKLSVSEMRDEYDNTLDKWNSMYDDTIEEMHALFDEAFALEKAAAEAANADSLETLIMDARVMFPEADETAAAAIPALRESFTEYRMAFIEKEYDKNKSKNTFGVFNSISSGDDSFDALRDSVRMQIVQKEAERHYPDGAADLYALNDPETLAESLAYPNEDIEKLKEDIEKIGSDAK